ncbi:MAG: oligosaccharide flippase family protein, partial [Candidatus Aminicenantes bacterium]|nr:oligosaccharide flippase family protein [Candidatus Aminicenantes bacterium]NIQ73033.1 oligosaccharide flippase family protein [Candidatus Aminicenantes bacterium]NIT29056.1 oligosaccharide flippase family protein [Candidatus Aminicenantes bacterium]
KAYLKVLQATAFVTVPMMGFIIVLSADFTLIFLGEKWMPIVPAMQVLACWAMVFSLNATIWPLFKAVGRPDLEMKLQALSLIIM